MSGLARAYAATKAPCSALRRGPHTSHPSAPAMKATGSASSPCTSTKASTPLASIARSAWKTSGERRGVGASYSPVVAHSRFRFAPHAFVRRWPRTAPSGFMLGTTWKVNLRRSETERPSGAAEAGGGRGVTTWAAPRPHPHRSCTGASTGGVETEQAAKQALREPARLRLARVLAVDDPDVLRPVANLDAVQLAPVQCLAKRSHPRARRRRAASDEVEVALIVVRVEVGKVDGAGIGAAVIVRPAERPCVGCVVRRVDSGPDFAVCRGADLQRLPPFGVACGAGVADLIADDAGLAGRGSEVKPLRVALLLQLSGRVGADL